MFVAIKEIDCLPMLNEVKLFSFENTIEISSLISSECTRIKCINS